MNEPTSRTESGSSESVSGHKLLILYTADAHEWAEYLQQIFKSSRKFPKRSILLYAVSPADQHHGYNFEYFRSCKCILVLVSEELLVTLCDPELQEALQKLLYPPQRVVALLCGVSEEEVLKKSFEDWPRWRKVSADDEPALYISTILESIKESMKNLIRFNYTSEKIK